MPVNGPREKLAADLELLKPVAGHVAYWSCGLIAGQSLTLGDLRALLAEPAPIPDIAIPISDALRQVDAALRSANQVLNHSAATIRTLRQLGRTDEDPQPARDACNEALAALDLLPALAQQMVEGEQRRVFLIDLQRRLDAVAPLIEQQRDDLVRTREALAVAEGALQSAPCKCFGLGLSSDFHECSRCSALARIAALSPTGTPGAKKGSPE